ncbi:MAG: hypothetical protein HZB16_15435 [Armatimonadetes bacterium]|nr:hypothetical protein [Armatimonadota bacterium]
MPEQGINRLTDEQFAGRLRREVKRVPTRDAACVLILGAGFSYGLVPTVRAMVRDIVWWERCQDDPSLNYEREPAGPANWYRERLAEVRGEHEAAKFDPGSGQFDPTLVYLTLMDPAGQVLFSADLRARYLHAVIAKAGNRLNDAHMFLAGLLAEQAAWPGERLPFCRTILTTNFDWFLQYALQLTQTLYFMSDQPGAIDPLTAGLGSAIHLVQAHGSAHHYRLCNNDNEIERAKAAAAGMVPYLQEHMVVVIGYSGWNDAIMAALESVPQFRHGLYWCDIVEPGDLGERARALLARHADAHYVKCQGADALMRRVYEAAAGKSRGSVPEFIRQPLKGLGGRYAACAESTQPFGGLQAWLERLVPELVEAQAHIDRALKSPENALLSKSYVLFDSNDWDAAIHALTTLVDQHELSPELAARARLGRAVSYGERKRVGDSALAVADYSAVVAMADAPAEQRAKALFNRGLSYGQSGDWALAAADYTAVAEMTDAPVELRAKSLVNRGFRHGQQGDWALAVADYTTVIEMADAPVEQKAKALVNRGFRYGQRGESGDWQRSVADYTAVAEMADAPVEQKAKALFNRGFRYGQRGQPGDSAREVADCTAVAQMADAPAKQKGKALFNLACVSALAGDVAGCVEHLARSHEVVPLTKADVDGDHDFDVIRSDPAFMAFRGGLAE